MVPRMNSIRKNTPLSSLNRYILWMRPQDGYSQRFHGLTSAQPGFGTPPMQFHESLLAGYAANESRLIKEIAILAGVLTNEDQTILRPDT